MKTQILYLAGGCFWGVEELFRQIPGVVATTVGYANGTNIQDANYKRVCKGDTGFRETVRVDFNPMRVAAGQILDVYFAVIDPTVANRQGNDIGTQYQTGIYWDATDTTLGKLVLTRIEMERTASLASGRPFYIEAHELVNFFPAEDYHQLYLVKNPGGYCHISPREMREALANFQNA